MSAEMDALVAQVEEVKGVEDSATAFLNALVPLLQDAAGDKAKTLAIAADIKSHTDALAAALAANQPPAPPA
jgi:hypothetical protein